MCKTPARCVFKKALILVDSYMRNWGCTSARLEMLIYLLRDVKGVSEVIIKRGEYLKKEKQWIKDI